jgi:amidase
MEPGIIELAETALARMEDLGWTVEPVVPAVPRELLWESWTDLRSFVVAQELGQHWRDPERREALNPQARWEVERGFAMTGETVERAAALRDEWLAALEVLFARFDALVLPSTQVWPFPAEWDWPREIAGQGMDTYHRWMEVVVPASLAGLPVLNLPAGTGQADLPGGVQLIGRAGADPAILAMGQEYEAGIGPRPIRL